MFPICTHDRSESKELSGLGEFNTSSHSRSFEDLRLSYIGEMRVFSGLGLTMVEKRKIISSLPFSTGKAENDQWVVIISIF